MTLDLTRLSVVVPRGHSLILHLHVPDYRPGRRARSIGDSAALCGVSVHGDPLVPLAEGLDLKPTGTDPRPAFRWCRNCLGHAVALVGLDRVVLDLVVKAAT